MKLGGVRNEGAYNSTPCLDGTSTISKQDVSNSNLVETFVVDASSKDGGSKVIVLFGYGIPFLTEDSLSLSFPFKEIHLIDEDKDLRITTFFSEGVEDESIVFQILF